MLVLAFMFFFCVACFWRISVYFVLVFASCFVFALALLLFWVLGRDENIAASLAVVLHMCMCMVAFTCDC